MADYYAAWLILSDVVGRSLSAVSIVLYYAVYPVFKILRAVALILSPFWALLQFALLPITRSAQLIITIALLPFRLHLLERFEKIYTYVGVAALIGCSAGALLCLSFDLLASTLGIAAGSKPDRRRNGRRASVDSSKEQGAKVESIEYPPTFGKRRAAHRRAVKREDLEENEDSL